MYEVVQKTARGRTANGKKSRKSNPVSMPVADFSRMRAYIQKKESANAARNVIQMVPDLGTVAYNRVLDLLQLRKWLCNQQEARDFITALPQEFRWMLHKNDSIKVKNIANYFLNKNPVTLKSIGLAPALLALLLQPAEIPEQSQCNEIFTFQYRELCAFSGVKGRQPPGPADSFYGQGTACAGGN